MTTKTSDTTSEWKSPASVSTGSTVSGTPTASADMIPSPQTTTSTHNSSVSCAAPLGH